MGVLGPDIQREAAGAGRHAGYHTPDEEIYSEISSSLTKAYQYPEAKQFLASLPVESLMGKSVEYYVGSRSTKLLMDLGTPRN